MLSGQHLYPLLMDTRNTDVKAVLIANIRRYRKARNLTQEKLAELSGLNSIADIEGGRSNPNLSTIVKIANSLEVEVWELFYCNSDASCQVVPKSPEATKQMIKDLVDRL